MTTQRKRTGLFKMASGVMSLMLAGSVAAQVGEQPQAGDVVFGLSNPSSFRTMQLVRGCGTKSSMVGEWTEQAFLQSVAFDNSGGFSHNARGNLLALNFGTFSGGGSLYNLATDGTETTELVFEFTAGAVIPTTRVSGLSVSPANDRIAVWANDTGSLMVLPYAAGPNPGSGSGAVVTEADGLLVPEIGTTGISQATGWLDNATALAYVVPEGGGSVTKLYKVDVAGPSPGNIELLIDIAVPGSIGGSQFLSIAYNPLISPYVFCMYSRFANGETTNRLSIIEVGEEIDLIDQFDFSQSINTAREIALGPDGFLYIGEYGGSDSPGPFINRIDVNDVFAIQSNVSEACYQAIDFLGNPIQSNFNGLDVAVEQPDDGLLGDLNNDGTVDGLDLLILLSEWGECQNPEQCVADINNDEVVDGLDLLILLSNWS